MLCLSVSVTNLPFHAEPVPQPSMRKPYVPLTYCTTTKSSARKKGSSEQGNESLLVKAVLCSLDQALSSEACFRFLENKHVKIAVGLGSRRAIRTAWQRHRGNTSVSLLYVDCCTSLVLQPVSGRRVDCGEGAILHQYHAEHAPLLLRLLLFYSFNILLISY